MARVVTALLHPPGVRGVDERLSPGVPQMAVLDVRFEPSATRIAAVAAVARHGLEVDPANHLPVTVDLLAQGEDPVAFVRVAVRDTNRRAAESAEQPRRR